MVSAEISANRNFFMFPDRKMSFSARLVKKDNIEMKIDGMVRGYLDRLFHEDRKFLKCLAVP
jgi:hypothetical protein